MTYHIIIQIVINIPWTMHYMKNTIVRDVKPTCETKASYHHTTMLHDRRISFDLHYMQHIILFMEKSQMATDYKSRCQIYQQASHIICMKHVYAEHTLTAVPHSRKGLQHKQSESCLSQRAHRPFCFRSVVSSRKGSNVINL